jgi:hypothetical protein
MKRNILSLAVTAGVAGLTAASAQSAMHINDKGLGEALIYPFYSTTSGNDTYIHVANTSAYSKAVKVRFIDAYNSAEVLDFNLYLSPEDVWTAAITNLDDGEPGIRTIDNSCTVPELGGPNPPFNGSKTTRPDGSILREQPFVNFQFLTDAQDRFAGNSTTPAEVEETDIAVRGIQGYIEIIEMGALDPDADSGTVGGTASYDYNKAVLHGPSGVPANCAAVVAAWDPDGGIWTTSSSTDFLDYDEDGSAGGLYGLGQIINTQDGTMASYDAVAIDDFSAFPTIGAPLHFAPGSVLPDLGSAQSTVTLFDGAAATDYTFTVNNYDPASALFMSSQIINDFLIDPAVLGQTDWVVTMPTKRPHVNTTTPTTLGQAIQPFLGVWNGQRACEPFSLQYWDREEKNTVIDNNSDFSPRPPGQITPDARMCAEVNIVTFNDDSTEALDESALGGSAGITVGFVVDDNEGWARLSFDPSDLVTSPAAVSDSAGVIDAGVARNIVADGGQTFVGLPVTGFAVIKYKDESGTNVSSEGAVLNYAGSFKHKVVTSIF